jgi:acetylornithine deacetylase
MEVPSMSEVLELLKALIRIDSVNPDLVAGAAGEAVAAAFVAEWLGTRGFQVQRLEQHPGRPSIVGIARGRGGGRTLMLNGHLDTVGVADYAGDPFDPKIENGRIHGRGSGDMKAGVAAMMVAAGRVADAGLAGDVLVACVADEECGSLGSEEVARAFRPDAVIITEPTALDITVTHKGFAWFDVTVEGRSAHGSEPENGVDAIVKAGHFLVALDAYDQRLRRAPAYPLLGTGSVHASLISGGQEMSSYPASCTVRLERRTLPGETPQAVAGDLQAIIDDLARNDLQFRAKIEPGLARDPLKDPGRSGIVDIVQAAAAARLGRSPALTGASGWGDGAVFNALGVPSIQFGHIGEGFHSATEWADIASVEALADILADVARRFCA